MLNKEVKQFILENDLVRITASPMSEVFDFWECPGGHVWNLHMIEQAINNCE
jgi:hypothetical protein